MRLVKRLAAAFFLALFAALAGTALWALWPERVAFDPAPLLAAAGRYDARIQRDRFGVPHIRGKTDADVAYGLAFAHSEDDFDTIQRVLLASRGRLASVEGLDAAPADFLFHWLGVPEALARYEEDVSPAARAVAQAYADGLNHYAALHPGQVLPGVVPASGRDVVAGFTFRTPFFYGLDRTVRPLFDEEHAPGEAPAARETAWAPLGPFTGTGSNAVAVGPARSADGATRLLVNSHQPYTGPVAWYEVRLRSEAGWDVAGGVFPGSPVVLHGANRTLGWASTVNTPDLADVYRLEIDPGDPDRYRLDGAWQRLEKREVELTVKLFGRLRWTVTRELLRSAHGPVIRQPHGTYALRFAGQGELRQLDQYLRMNRAASFAEWREAMRMQAIPSVNFVYADRAGNIAYFYNARFPKRVPGLDWQGVLPGDRSELIWRETLGFDAVPQVVNPPAGFVANANHTPFRSTLPADAPDPARFPPELGIEPRLTNRGLRALELFGGDASITREEFRAYKYDKQYAAGSEARRIVGEVLAARFDEDPDLIAGQKLLREWRGGAEADDPAAALAILTATPVVLAQMRGLEPPSVLGSYRAAVRTLRRHHGGLAVPWGEVNRFRRGPLDLPADGGPDVLRALESFELGRDGTYTVNSGDSLVMFVEWDRAGRQTVETIHQFGSATLDAGSPHYADQVEPFLAEETKVVPMDEASLRAQLEREYRPGETDASP
jgi:penicillin amidase/acyl-homoserine-lactone acylase